MEGLVSWIPYIISGIAAVLSIITLRGQLQKDRANNTATYQGIADKAAIRAVAYETRIDALETKVRILEISIVELEDWARRLCEQVVSLNGTPVKRYHRRAVVEEPIKEEPNK